MIKVLYVGDTALFISYELVGVEFAPILDKYEDYSVHLGGALRKDPEIGVVHMPAFTAHGEFPKTAKEIGEYDVIILSDVSYDTLALYPGEQKFKVPMGPNRLIEIKKYVENGGAMAFCGGWLSFQGRYGYGNWYGTPIAEVLPLEILPIADDRVERPEGVKPIVTGHDHPIMENIPWDTCPPFLGYNKAGRVKEGATLLATIGDDDPFIAVWTCKKGSVLAFTSDPAPHWGTGFVGWEFYAKFWIQAVKWLAKKGVKLF